MTINDGIEMRKKFHPLLLEVMKLKRKIKGDKLVVDGDFIENSPVLIVANHLTIDDIPTLAEAVEDHFYLLVSDEDEKTLNGKVLSANGVQWITRTCKESRIYSKEKAIEYLEKVNFAMYPEATWNLSPNLLMLPMNYGCVVIAKEANVKIRPVVTVFCEGKRYTKIGDTYDSADKSPIEAVAELRDLMSTMVYESFRKYYQDNRNLDNVYSTLVDGEEYLYEKRSEIDPYYWDNYVKQKYDAYPRAKADPEGVRFYESQFIFEPKTDDYAFFQIFNSSIRYDEDGNMLIKRISSENGGYSGTTCDSIDYTKFFGYGYNESNFRKVLEKNYKL